MGELKREGETQAVIVTLLSLVSLYEVGSHSFIVVIIIIIIIIIIILVSSSGVCGWTVGGT